MNLPLNIPADIDKYFYNRKEDIKLINAYLNMLNEGIANQILVTGFRAVGKTFFLKKVLHNQPDSILTSYVDLSKIYGKEFAKISEEEVLKEILKQINHTILEYEGKIPNFKNDIINWIKQLPLKSYDFTNSTNILDIPIPEIKDNYSKLSEFVMELPQKIVDQYDNINGFIIVIDEFQNLKNLENPDAFFWLMRSFSQTQHNVTYIFTGSISNTSDIIDMINGPTGAYGGRMIQINIKPFSKEETFNYITERTNLTFTDDGFKEFYELTRGMPSYINSFCNVLDSSEIYDKKKIINTFLIKLDQINVLWLTVWGTFSETEKTIIINLLENEKMSWNDLMSKISYSKSTIIKYVEILNNRGIIDHYYNRYVISDSMLKTWLKYKKEMDGHYPY
ncbi:MAG: ATP-binding protein [Methanosphaera stadtmanae]|nr:ATP-binding protein [Methanosphaera stadtmanae]